jgi:hypothetical protein
MHGLGPIRRPQLRCKSVGRWCGQRERAVQSRDPQVEDRLVERGGKVLPGRQQGCTGGEQRVQGPARDDHDDTTAWQDAH